jgi:hypothetical protein
MVSAEVCWLQPYDGTGCRRWFAELVAVNIAESPLDSASPWFSLRFRLVPATLRYADEGAS